MRMSHGLRIGVTGGIGCGKSTVAALLESCGALRFDADAVSRGLTAARGLAMPLIVERFGASAAAPDGSLDRAAMRRLVFADPARRRELEDILHPMIAQQRQAFLAQAGPRAVVLDIPLMAESARGRGGLDRIVVVDCLESTQIDRVVSRSGLDPDEVRAVMATQATRPQRLSIADAVIFNERLSLEQLGAAVARLWTHWQGMRPH